MIHNYGAKSLYLILVIPLVYPAAFVANDIAEHRRYAVPVVSHVGTLVTVVSPTAAVSAAVVNDHVVVLSKFDPSTLRWNVSVIVFVEPTGVVIEIVPTDAAPRASERTRTGRPQAPYVMPAAFVPAVTSWPMSFVYFIAVDVPETDKAVAEVGCSITTDWPLMKDCVVKGPAKV